MWVGIALLVEIILYCLMGEKVALDFIGAYLIELSLSIDNLFVFLSIFRTFGVEERHRHRILKFGIIGAAILRMLFVILGAAVIDRYQWVLYIFGFILFGNGIKMLTRKEIDEGEKQGGIGMDFIRRIIPVTKEWKGERFFVREENKAGGKRWYATPLFAVLVIVEVTDIIFAIDSVPAVFSVTGNPFIVYSSNLLAILGLRQMYFVLEKIVERFAYVKYGIALILMFTGTKLLGAMFGCQISTGVSVAVLGVTMLLSIVISIILTKKLVNK